MSEISNDSPSFHEVLNKSFEHLLRECDPSTSSSAFVQQAGTMKPGEEFEEKEDLIMLRDRIGLPYESRGFGYLSLPSFDKSVELQAAVYVADSFKGREPSTTPFIVPVDLFYEFAPSNASLVRKTELFNTFINERVPSKAHAIVLSGFTDSKIFNSETLALIPHQLKALENPSVTQALMDFAQNKLPKFLEEENGNLEAVLSRISGLHSIENAQLLLVTGLLLQDIQAWQSLWKCRTPLFIVAPEGFHDAINRLNFLWGHGSIDYNYRAKNSLGVTFLGQPSQDPYHKQGLSAEEFRQRIGPLLTS